MNMRKQQQGMTAIGFILMLMVFGFIAFGVIQLVPVYLENMKVVQVLNQIKSDLDGQNASLVDIRKSLQKRIDIEDLRDINWRTDFVISRSGNGYYVSTEYERTRAFVANIYLLAEFEHEVEILR
jgi:hypothetical protein